MQGNEETAEVVEKNEIKDKLQVVELMNSIHKRRPLV